MSAPGDCDYGHYCPSYSYFFDRELDYEAYKCPAGTYNPSTGASSDASCLACDAGKYCSMEGQ